MDKAVRPVSKGCRVMSDTHDDRRHFTPLLLVRILINKRHVKAEPRPMGFERDPPWWEKPLQYTEL